MEQLSRARRFQAKAPLTTETSTLQLVDELLGHGMHRSPSNTPLSPPSTPRAAPSEGVQRLR